MVALSGVLLHLTTLAQWAPAAVTGTYGADQVSAGGFVHMSTPDQVGGPANALFAGRTDVWLLVVDADRLPVAPRWEAGDPPAAGGERFPHLYAPLPARAVVAAVPYPPGPDGRFGRPVGLPEPDDQLQRAHALEWYLARAGETLEGQIGAKIPVRHRELGHSDQHNRLVLREDQTPAEAARLCADELGGERWHVRIVGPIAAATISAYEWAGWSYAENLLMVASAAPTRDPDPGVQVTATPDEAADSPDSLRRDLPRLLDPELRHLVEREAVTSGVARHLHLAVLDDDGQPLSEADVLIAGATAQIDNMITRPDQRGRGLATAVVLEAVHRAHTIGCDVVFLRTAAGDGPWHTYEQLGFRTIETAHDFDRAPLSR